MDAQPHEAGGAALGQSGRYAEATADRERWRFMSACSGELYRAVGLDWFDRDRELPSRDCLLPPLRIPMTLIGATARKSKESRITRAFKRSTDVSMFLKCDGSQERCCEIERRIGSVTISPGVT